MNEFLQNFVQEEDGAQVVEYALIIALVAIALAIALGNLEVPINDLKDRVVNCVKSTTGTC